MQSWRDKLKEELVQAEAPICREQALSLSKSSGQVASNLSLDDLISKLESESKGALGQKRFNLERVPDGFQLTTAKFMSSRPQAGSYRLKVKYEAGKTSRLRLSFEALDPDVFKKQLLFLLLGQPVLLYVIARDLNLMMFLLLIIPIQIAMVHQHLKSAGLADMTSLLNILCKNAGIKANEISLESSIVK